MLKYEGFSLISPNNHQSEKIDQIIRDFNGSIFHEVELNKIVQRNFNSELLYLVNDPESISCFTPVHITRNKFGFRTYNCQPLGDIPFGGFVGDQIIDPNKFSIGFFESLKYVGFPYIRDIIHSSNVNFKFGETNIIDLSLKEDEIFSKMDSSKRRNIRKAKKSGIYVKTYTNEQGLTHFWPILRKLHDNLGFKRFSLDYYKNFLRIYGPQKKAFILIAFKEKVPISGLLLLGNNHYMHFYKGASLFSVKREGQGELLHWEAVRLSKSLGLRYYDFCNLDKEKLPAIYKFKTGFSKNVIEYPKLSKNSLGFKIINRI